MIVYNCVGVSIGEGYKQKGRTLCGQTERGSLNKG